MPGREHDTFTFRGGVSNRHAVYVRQPGQAAAI